MRSIRISLYLLTFLAIGPDIQAEPLQGYICQDSALPEDKIRGLIVAEATDQGVDPKLALAIAQHESGFGARVNSPAGARGVMQLMPATAERYGVKDICDTAENVRGGIRYLNDLNALFDGNILLMVAAYNAGENRVIEAGGIPAIAETVNYTALVTNTYFGLQNAIERGRRGAAGKTKAAAPAPAPDVLTVDAGQNGPIPINQSRNGTSGNDWLGGSVLYVQ